MHGPCAKRIVPVVALAAAAFVVAGCGRRSAMPSTAVAPSTAVGPSDAATPSPAGATAMPVVVATAPAVLARLHVPLDRVRRISRFRSGVGHDYSDGIERCRSMKHYFQFDGGEPGTPHVPSWTTVPVVSPLDGTVTAIRPEWAGDQIRIRSAADPRYTVVLFHVRRATGVDDGIALWAGQALGFHASDETMSDLAVEVEDASLPQGRRLVSAFDVLADAAFAALAERGVAERSALIIGRAERDADPLTCDGERFTSPSTVDDWVDLTAPSDPSPRLRPTP